MNYSYYIEIFIYLKFFSSIVYKVFFLNRSRISDMFYGCSSISRRACNVDRKNDGSQKVFREEETEFLSPI